MLAGSVAGDKPGVVAAAPMAQLVRAATALRDLQRETRNLREAQALDGIVRQLAGLQWVGYGPEPRDSRKVEQVRQRQTRTPRPGPVLEVPRGLDPGSQMAAPSNRREVDRDADDEPLDDARR